MKANFLTPWFAVLLVVVVLAAGVTSPVSASPADSKSDGRHSLQEDDPDDDDDDDDEKTVVNINLDEVVNKIGELIDEFNTFTTNWDATLRNLLIAVLFRPFQLLAQKLLESQVLVLTTTPNVHPNPAVESVHRQTLLVTYLLSGLAFMAAGVLYMIGPVVGVSYAQARQMLPRLLLALVFASFSPQLLQLTVDLSDALVTAFAPAGLTMSVTELAGLSVSLVLVWVINSTLLLVLVVIFIIRDVYLLFVVAISPLLALAWAVPPTKRYADTFIAGYWTALAMAPLDVLVLRLNLSLLEGAGASGLQSLSNWMLGVAGFTLLILVPYQLYGASQAAVGQAYAVSGQVKSKLRDWRRPRYTPSTEVERWGRDQYRRYRGTKNEFLDDLKDDW